MPVLKWEVDYSVPDWTPPEDDVMSPEAEAFIMQPTDPDACSCGHHQGLANSWHRPGCAARLPEARV